MSHGLRAGVAPSPRLGSIIPALLMAGALLGACFDSDEKPVPLSPTTSTTGPLPGTSSTSTTAASTSTGTPEVTCRDAIDCVVGCAGELQMSNLPEPDLTCFLECEPGLTVGEVLHLFRLTECVTNKCIDQGVCDFLVPTETSSGSSSSGDESTSTGGSSSSGTGTGTGTGTSTTGPAQPDNPCLDCILANMLDTQLGGECQALADKCV